MLSNWHRQVQIIIDEIDSCIRDEKDESMTLKSLASKLGYSEFYVSRKFSFISGMRLKDYIRLRKLAFAFKEIRDFDNSILNISVKYGYSSHESFTRAFQKAYGITPSEYRKKPRPVVLQTLIKPFDCFLMEGEKNKMNDQVSTEEIKIYFVKIPEHKFLHIRNYESIGY